MPCVLNRLVALTLAAFAALGQAPAQAQGPAAVVGAPTTPSLDDQARNLTRWGDLESLERLYNEVKQPGRYTPQGNALVANFHHGTDRALGTPRDTGEAFMVEVDAMTLDWTQKRPASPLVHWLRAQALVNRAWEVRGSGFSKEVAPQAWAAFTRHLESAVQHVANMSAVSLQDSTAYVELINAGRGLGWDLSRQEQLVVAGRQRNPDDLSLWHALLTSSLPKWQGNPVLVDRLIRRAADQHKERGDEIYARLYFSAADEDFSHTVFRDTAADWPRIRKGLRDSISRWPAKAVFWNRLAYFACLKEDRETLTEALDKLQDKPDLEQWGTNARRVFETCQKLSRQG